MLISLLSGASIGLLIGVLAGLSSSPVVSALVGTLGSLLAAFLASKGTSSDAQNQSQGLDRLSIVGFGLLAVVGLSMGIYFRTHSVFSPSVKDEVSRWTGAGFSQEESRRIVAFRLGGLVPQGFTVQPSPGMSILFGATVEECEQSNPTKLRDSLSMTNAFKVAGSRWQNYNQVLNRPAINALPEDAKIELYRATWRLVCAKR